MFFEIFIGVLIVVFAFVINVGGLIFWYEKQPYNGWSPVKLLILGLSVFSASLWLAGFIFIINESEKPPPNVVEWEGGQGPDTVCWYADKDNPDQIVSTGKSVVVPGDGFTRYTWCSTNGKDIPDGVKPG